MPIDIVTAISSGFLLVAVVVAAAVVEAEPKAGAVAPVAAVVQGRQGCFWKSPYP